MGHLRLDSMVTQNEALEIATGHAKKLGYRTDSMQPSCEKLNTPWNKWLAKEDDDEFTAPRKKLLEGKEYWAIYFSPKTKQFGGDIAVFVDAQTGKVLTDVRGK